MSDAFSFTKRGKTFRDALGPYYMLFCMNYDCDWLN